jgi:hypothetical protein
MKNIKLVKADFDRETGISTVIINTDIGKFEGVAKADDVDIQSPSQFMGCELAELRALKKYVKAKFMNIKRVNESLLKVADAIQVHPDSRIDYPFSALKIINDEINRNLYEMEKWCNLNKTLENDIKNFYIKYEEKLKLLDEKIKKLKEKRQ